MYVLARHPLILNRIFFVLFTATAAVCIAHLLAPSRVSRLASPWRGPTPNEPNNNILVYAHCTHIIFI